MGMQHTSMEMRHTSLGMQHASMWMQHTVYNIIHLMLLIPLDAAGSDLSSLPAPFFHHQLMVVVLVRCAGFQDFFPLFLK